MSSVRALLTALMLMPHVVQGQPTNAPAAGPVFAVAYVEMRATEAEAGRAALALYLGPLSIDSPAAWPSSSSLRRDGPGTSPCSRPGATSPRSTPATPRQSDNSWKPCSQSASATTTSGPTNP